MDNFGQKVIRFMVLTFVLVLCSSTVLLIAVVKIDEANETVTVTSVPERKEASHDHS